MENSRRLSEELGLPKLQPREPWFGYELGYWSDEEREEAELALAGNIMRSEKGRRRTGRNYNPLATAVRTIRR
jgi:hypothetical protein